VEETDKVIAEIDHVSQQYLPLAQACSSIYFMLESLHQIHFLYQFSLQFFLDVFSSVLTSNPELAGKTEPAERLAIITQSLFSVCYGRVARGMAHQHRLTLALLLSRIRLRGASTSGQGDLEEEFDFVIRGKEGIVTQRPANVSGLSNEQAENVVRLAQRLPAFEHLADHVGSPAFQEWLQTANPELDVPTVWTEERATTPAAVAMHRLLMIQTFRPDRVLAAGHQLVDAVFGERFMPDAERELDLAHIVEHEVRPGAPVLLCSVSGYDASGRVDDLAAELGRPVTSIAIGSAEGFNQAERVINQAVKTGRWVMLKNVHLAASWLIQLEKKLHTLQPNANFRLFLTMEISPKIPVNLLRAGRILVFEPPPGIRANLLRTFNSVPASRMMKPPSERARIYFLLAWFHAVVQERLRYAPLGWSKSYEFNESDLRSACDTLDTWIEATAMGRTNLPPEKVPWSALQTLLSQCIYGGKIDNDFDQRLLGSFLDKLFTPASFDSEFALVAGAGPDGKDIGMPDGIRRDQFLQWVEQMTDRQTPAWLGLPNNAEKLLLTTRGTDMVASLLRMQLLEDDGESAYVEEGEDKKRHGDERPAWMRSLHNSGRTWSQLLPRTLQTLRRTVENIRDPLYRYFEREVNIGARLLTSVQGDIRDILDICEGTKKQTNYHRQMVAELVRGVIPALWRQYKVPATTTVIQWITDFAQRVKQLHTVSQAVAQGSANALKTQQIWLGGLFNPEAYVTATRQCVAQANSWSLEELQLRVTVAESDAAVPAGSMALRGVRLQGALCKNNQLQLTTTIQTELPQLQLAWQRGDAGEDGLRYITLPVYLNATRGELLFTVRLPIAGQQSEHSFYERGVALVASTSLN